MVLFRVPPCCLTDEHLMPRAQVTGGIEKLTAELGKESQQPEQGAVDLFDAEPDPGLKIKECSSGLPRDRVSNPREEGDCLRTAPWGCLSEQDSLQGSALHMLPWRSLLWWGIRTQTQLLSLPGALV